MQTLKYTVIKNRKQYNQYCNSLDELIELDEPTQEQQQEIELMTVLVEKWDAEHSTFRDLDPVQLIKSLMQEHQLSSAGLMDILEISKSYLSEILNYRKGLSKDVIRKLATHFKMTQDVFNRPYTLQPVQRVWTKSPTQKTARVHKIKTASSVRQASKKVQLKRGLQPA
jgi:HTH-type transcriptional regulator/antitoxin HigA